MLAHKGTHTLTTDRLILRQFVINDAQAMYDNWATDIKTTQYLSWNIHSTVDETKALLEKWISYYENLETYNWVIEFNKNIVGNINTHDLSNSCSRCEIGYCMGSKYWNMGIMSEALGAVMKYLFKEIGINRIVAKHDTINIYSGKVMQKNGMILEGVMREHAIHKDGTYHDLACYGILRKEWANEKPY